MTVSKKKDSDDGLVVGASITPDFAIPSVEADEFAARMRDAAKRCSELIDKAMAEGRMPTFSRQA